jgi:hypothetical protein
MKKKVFELRNGNMITPKMLVDLEDAGKSESEIAEMAGISRQYLHRIRQNLGCPVRFRSDRGTVRKSYGAKRDLRAENARRRYIPKDSELVYCYFCGEVWDSRDGIKAQERGLEMRYACGDCCRSKFDKGDDEEIWKYEEEDI